MTISRSSRPVLALPALLVSTLAIGGCDSLLDVELPDRVLAEELLRPENATTLMSGVIADYECSHAAYVSWTAALGDEFLSAGSGDGVEQRSDIRTESPSNWATGDCGEGIVGLFIPISVARWGADNLLDHLERWTDDEVPGRTDLIATAAAYSGYAHLFHTEAMCETAFDGGPRIGPSEVLARAEDRFTRALEAAEASGNDEMRDLALVGRARTRLDMARTEGELVAPAMLEAAADDARRVSESFSFTASYSTVSSRTENHVWAESGPGAPSIFSTVGEPYRNATVEGEPDPRLPVIDTGEETDEGLGVPLFQQLKYVSVSDPIEVASWEEAQLIVAEAELEAGNLQEAVAIINELRRRVGLPDTFASDDPAEVWAALIHERRAELFLEGQLLGDQSRYDLPFSPPPGAETARGFVYETTRCFPLPDVEVLNNANIR